MLPERCHTEHAIIRGSYYRVHRASAEAADWRAEMSYVVKRTPDLEVTLAKLSPCLCLADRLAHASLTSADAGGEYRIFHKPEALPLGVLESGAGWYVGPTAGRIAACRGIIRSRWSPKWSWMTERTSEHTGDAKPRHIYFKKMEAARAAIEWACENVPGHVVVLATDNMAVFWAIKRGYTQVTGAQEDVYRINRVLREKKCELEAVLVGTLRTSRLEAHRCASATRGPPGG